MPYTELEKSNILRNAGYDPSKHWFHEPSGSVFPLEVPQADSSISPPSGESQVNTPVVKESTIGEALKLGFQKEIGPSAAGFLTAAGTAALINPATHPVASWLAPMVTGLGASFGASALQDKFAFSPETKQRMSEVAEQRPISTFAGELGGQAVFVNPIRSAASLIKLAKNLPNALRAKALTDAERALLANAAISTGVSAGSEGYSQFQRGEFDPLSLAGRSLGFGLLGLEPTAVGRKLGFKGSEDFSGPTPGELLPPDTTFYGPEMDIKYAQRTPSEIGSDVVGMTRGGRVKSAEHSARSILQAESAQRQREFELAKEEVRIKDAELAVKERELMERQLNLNQIQDTTLGPVNPQKTYMKGMEKANESLRSPMSEAEKIELDFERRDSGRKFQENDTTISSIPKPIRTKQEEAAFKRGVNIQYTDKSLGGVGAGSSQGNTARISTTKAGLDTIPHEGQHIALDRLRNSTSSSDRKIAQRALEAIKKKQLNEKELALYNKLKEKGFTDEDIAEEFLVAALGKSGYYRTKGQITGETSKYREWWDDVKANFKVKLHLGNVDDMVRHLDARYHYDAPFGTRREVMGLPTGVASNQEGDPIQHSSIEDVKSARGKDFVELPKKWGRGLTAQAYEVGKLAKGNPEAIDFLKREQDRAISDIANKLKSTDQKIQMEGIMESSKAQFFREAWEYATDSGSAKGVKYQEGGPVIREEGNYGEEIESRLGEASFNAAKSTAKAQHEINEHRKLTAERENLQYKDVEASKEMEEDIADKGKLASFKANELEAFTRPDVERNQEGEPIKEKGFKGAAQQTLERQLKDPKLNRIIAKIDSGEPLNPDEVSYAERVEIPPGAHPQMSTKEWKEKQDAWVEKIYRNQETEPIPNASKSSHAFIPAFASAIDKVRKVDNEVANAVDRFTVKRESYEGRYRNEPYANVSTLRLSEKERNEVFNYLRLSIKGKGSLPTLSAKGKEALNIIKPVWDDIAAVRDSEGLDPSNVDVLNDKAIQLLTTKQNTPEHTKAVNDWASFVASEDNVPVEEARKHIRTFVRTISGAKLYASEYLGYNRAQHYSIPPSLRENDIQKVLLKYGRRNSQDIAFWQELQNKPRIASALSLPTKGGSVSEMKGVTSVSDNPHVKNMMKYVFNDFETIRAHPRINALARIFTNSKLGVATGIRDIIQIPVFSLPYVETLKDVGAFYKAFGALDDARKASLRSGVRKPTLDLDRWYALESPDSMTSTFNKIAEGLRKWQGREHLEQGARIFTFALGKEMAKPKVLNAARGNKGAIEWLEKFSTGVDNKDYNTWGPDELNQVAANFTTRVQGSYDARGLPAGAFDSQFAPFFSLARWSIEKSNIIHKDVFAPMKKGNFKPFLLYTLGSVLTGEAIRQVNEVLSGKKDYSPSWEESEGRNDFRFGAFVNLLQMAGYAGIMGDLAKVGTDVAIQKEMPRGPINFPMADFLTEDLAASLLGAKQALDEGASPDDIAIGFAWEAIAKQVQNLRMLDRGDNDRKDRFRDMRVFKKLEGDNVPAFSSASKEIVESPEKKFKRTDSLEEAAEMLPKALENILKNSKGDPDKLKSELRGLKINSYQTFPNFETQPTKFQEYYNFLSRTQGKDAALARLQEWMIQREKNRVKGEMVPDI